LPNLASTGAGPVGAGNAVAEWEQKRDQTNWPSQVQIKHPGVGPLFCHSLASLLRSSGLMNGFDESYVNADGTD
jgi:hypothetical protein